MRLVRFYLTQFIFRDKFATRLTIVAQTLMILVFLSPKILKKSQNISKYCDFLLSQNATQGLAETQFRTTFLHFLRTLLQTHLLPAEGGAGAYNFRMRHRKLHQTNLYICDYASHYIKHEVSRNAHLSLRVHKKCPLYFFVTTDMRCVKQRQFKLGANFHFIRIVS